MKNILSPFVASLPLSIAITISAPLNALAQDYGLHSEHSTTIAPTQASDKEGKTRADWRWEEDKLIATLGTKPKESLAALNAEINKRRREDPKNPSLSFSLNVIGYQLTELGRYADAEPFLKEAIALRKALRSTKPAELGQSYSNLALLFIEQGRIKDAEPLILEAIKLRAEDTEDPSAVAKSRIVLARLYAARGELVNAEEQLKEALRSFDTPSVEKSETVPWGEFLLFCAYNIANPGGSNIRLRKFGYELKERYTKKEVPPYFRLKALIDLSGIFIAEGKHHLARRMLDIALDKAPSHSIYTTNHLGHDKLEARAYEKLGLLAIAQGNLSQARQYLAEAESRAKALNAAPPVYVAIYSALGDLNRKSQKKKEAAHYYRRAAELQASMTGAANARVKALRNLADSVDPSHKP